MNLTPEDIKALGVCAANLRTLANQNDQIAQDAPDSDRELLAQSMREIATAIREEQMVIRKIVER